MKVIAVILHFGNVKFTIDCYNDLKSQEGGVITDIIIVDNDKENPLNLLPSSGLTILINENNDGYAKGNNLALRYISENLDCDYVIIANNDIHLPQKTIVSQLLDELRASGSKAISPLLKKKVTESTPLVVYSRFYNKIFKALNEHGTLVHSEMLSGCFMLIDFNVFKAIDFIDESFFMYGEDIDLSYRIVKESYKNFYFPSVFPVTSVLKPSVPSARYIRNRTAR